MTFFTRIVVESLETDSGLYIFILIINFASQGTAASFVDPDLKLLSKDSTTVHWQKYAGALDVHPRQASRGRGS